MQKLNISKAVYWREVDGIIGGVIILINGDTDMSNNINKIFVPLDPANRHYSEIMRQIEAGELVIEEAEQ